MNGTKFSISVSGEVTDGGLPKNPEDFPNRPCCVCVRNGNSSSMISINSSSSGSNSTSSSISSCKDHDLSHCTPIPVETSNFSGVCYLLLAGVTGSPDMFFSRHKRRLQYVVQGRFKQRISFSHLYTGQAWEDPLAAAPPLWIQSLLLPVIKGLQPGVRLQLLGEHPYILSPLVSTLQVLQVHLPGSEPTLPGRIEELVNDDLQAIGLDMSSKARKSYFSITENLEKHAFCPDYVCTFSFYQHFVRMDTFSVFGFDLLQILGRNPIQVMAVVLDPSTDSSDADVDDWKFLYRIDIWHEKVLSLPRLSP